MRFLITILCFSLFLQSHSLVSASKEDTLLQCSPPITKDLALGDKDNKKSSDVASLQKFLMSLNVLVDGWTIVEASGEYDLRTTNAVAHFQDTINIVITEDPKEAKKIKLEKIPTNQLGAVGKETRNAISAICKSLTRAVSSAATKRDDAFIKLKLSNIRAIAEIYYVSNSYNYGKSGTCKNGLFKDGSLSKDISDAVCRSKAEAFIAYAPLSKNMYCVDSTGFAGDIKSKPKKDSYTCIKSKTSEKKDKIEKLKLQKKNYTDKNNSWTMDYVKGSSIEKSNFAGGEMVTFHSSNKMASVRVAVNKGVYGSTDTLNLKNAITEKKKTLNTELKNVVITESSTSLSKLPAQKLFIKWEDNHLLSSEIITLSHKSILYELTFTTYTSSWKDYSKFFSTSLDSFSLIK